MAEIPKPLFEELFRLGGFARLIRYFRSRGLSLEDAQDLASDVSVKVIQGYDRIPPSVSLDVWLMMVASDYFVKRSRSSWRGAADTEGSAALDLLADLLPSDEDVERNAIERDQLQKAMNKLEAEHPGWAQAVQLYAVEGLTISELAGTLGRSEAATKNIIYKALNRLREFVES